MPFSLSTRIPISHLITTDKWPSCSATGERLESETADEEIFSPRPAGTFRVRSRTGSSHQGRLVV